MTTNKNDILKRIQALTKEKEANRLNKRLAELTNQLYEMDIDAMDYEVNKGYMTRKEADDELARRRNLYFA
jgi:translation initiation factor IF-2